MSAMNRRHLKTVELAARIAARLDDTILSEARRASLERTLDALAWALAPSELDCAA